MIAHEVFRGLSRACFASSAIALALAAACDQTHSSDAAANSKELPQREVVIYASTDEAIARPILAAFEKSTGIRVRARYDSENSKATALAAMIRTEQDAPRADLFWSGECFAAAQLAREGLVQPWRSQRVDKFPSSMRGMAGRWYGLPPRARVLVYDPSRINQDDLPKSMMDLADPMWRGSVAIADPRFGTTRGHMGALAYVLELRETGAWNRWVVGFCGHSPRVLVGGNAAVVDAVVRGESTCGLTDSDDVYAAIAGGANLAMLPIRQFPLEKTFDSAGGVAGYASGGGAMLIPGSVALVTGAPHQREALELMTFLLSRDVFEWLQGSRAGNLLVTEIQSLDAATTTPSVRAPADLPPFEEAALAHRLHHVEDPFVFDADACVEQLDAQIALLMRPCAAENDR
ncbi:MAG: extracellular solute-binding protein [Phycisphaerales bacterium]|nr:extracellular solute-binding protein [Phycisphaerales bacterium]